MRSPPLLHAALLALTTLAATSAAAAPCALTGRASPSDSARISGGAGDRPLARFTGQRIGLSVTLADDHASVVTTGGFRLEGKLALGDVPLVSARRVAIAKPHVSLGAGLPLVILSAAAGAVKVRFRASPPLSQTLEATATCADLSLDPVRTSKDPPPDGARGWRVKRAPVELFAGPRGARVFTLTESTIEDALLFWGTETQDGRVHVFLSGELVVDAWAPVASLAALPPGEIPGAASVEVTTTTPPRITLGGARKVTAPRRLVLRDKGDDSGATIGHIDPGTDLLVVESMLGYASVVPAELTLLPVEGRGLWVRAKDLE